MSIAEKADKIMERAHGSIDQRRKWGPNNDPYEVHPRRVTAKIKILPGTNEVDEAACELHDVLEDVAIKLGKVKEYEDEIRRECGEEVLALVWELTNPSDGPGWEHKSRAEKRVADWAHLAGVSDRAKRIKMVDRWDNLGDYKYAPRKYMVQKYLPESRHLLGMCRYVDEEMGKELEARIEEAEAYFQKHSAIAALSGLCRSRTNRD